MKQNPLDARLSKPLEGGPSFSIRHRAFRFIWGFVWVIFAAWTPPFLYKWRNLLLRLFGAKIHNTAKVYGKARIWFPPNLKMDSYSILGPKVNCYSMDKIEIGESAIVSQGAYLCCGTHDISDPYFQLITKPIHIKDNSWVAADAFIGPGVTVGSYAVIGARTVLFKNAEPYGIYAGNPAKLIKYRSFKGE